MTRVLPRTRRGSGWALGVALVVSILVHLAIYVCGTLGYERIASAVDPSAATRSAAAPQEVVTVSHPLVIERRTTPIRNAPTARRPFVRAPRHFDFPSGPFGHARSAPARTPAEIAFAEAMRRNARLRAAADPNDPATAPRRYQLSLRGKNTRLRRGQGIYFPTRGWRQNGLDYYDVSYEFVYPNGTDEKGSVPWPIHFPPGADPFFSSDPDALSTTPMPGPPPGFVPPGDLGKALRAYFPNLRFEDAAP